MTSRVGRFNRVESFEKYGRLRGLVLCGLMLAFSAPFAAADYTQEWGLEVGDQAPAIAALDQAGTPREFENLRGEQGLLLFMNRSADW